MLRILVADDERDMRDYFCKFLPRLGYEVVAAVEDGQALIEQCRSLKPDLIITDIEMPIKDGLTASEEICAATPIPIILVTAYNDAEYIRRARQESIFAYMIKPIKMVDLEPAIALAMERFKQFQTLQNETETLRQALADRKLVEQAKGILMKRANLTEAEAFTRLQKISNERNQKMVVISQSIIEAEEAFTS